MSDDNGTDWGGFFIWLIISLIFMGLLSLGGC